MIVSKFFSSGGLGDAWICFLKILPFAEAGPVSWYHINGNECHVDVIAELMRLMPNAIDLKSILVPKIEAKTKKVEGEFFAKNPDAIRLTSIGRTIERPRLKDSIFWTHFKAPFVCSPKSPYHVIQPIAGRLNDNSKREIRNSFITRMAEESDIPIVLIGHGVDFHHDNVINLTGQTTIQQAVSILSNAASVLAYDGFCAYVAMSCEIPTTILWHLPNLPGHYMNKAWLGNTKQKIVGSIVE